MGIYIMNEIEKKELAWKWWLKGWRALEQLEGYFHDAEDLKKDFEEEWKERKRDQIIGYELE